MFDNELLNQLRQAIEVEQKNQYINIIGRESNFSTFILKQLHKFYKLSKKNPKWILLIKEFETYEISTFPIRRKAIQRLIKVLKEEINSGGELKKVDQTTILKKPEDTDVMYVKGVGPKIGNLLNRLGIYTAKDLLFYFPKKHIDYSSRTFIRNLKEGTDSTVIATIKSISTFNSKNKLGIVSVTVADETGSMKLNFFYAKANRFLLERYKSQFIKGSNIIVSGKAKIDKYSGTYTIDKPEFQVLSGEFESNSNLNLARIVPVYQLVDGLNVKTLRRAIFNAIEQYESVIENVIPNTIAQKHGLLERKLAIKQIHFPDNVDLLEKARYTLVFEEFFLIQLKLAMLREENSKNVRAISLKIKSDGLVNQFISSLPFKLTPAQERVVNEILVDIASEIPMQRLLQGDVGSGKTVVACIMLLSAVENGYQGVLMAPTEILAQQHFNNFLRWLTPLGLNVSLFTGTNTTKVRKKLEMDLKNGQINIAIGTHALIQDNIEFSNLGAIVIDEQHRFGVKQRSLLMNKGDNPQVLTMTATPIPRTLALTTQGDLDFSIIDELPANRKPIKTYVIKQSQRTQAYQMIRNEINNGHQCYVVYPLIDESETLSAKAATKESERLQAEIFPDFKIGLLHGKLSNQEKDDVMEAFKSKHYDILVSTTVVEVGVDVPNSTVMMIENAERFGLSQLHQLRGRVGRSDLQSYCILVPANSSETTMNRLQIMADTNNGFVISEKDLELRGPGEFLGTKQSGMLNFALADIVKDTKILELARKEAFDYVNSLENASVSELLQKELQEKFRTVPNLSTLD